MAMGTYKLKRLIAFFVVGIMGAIIAPFLFLMSFPLISLFIFSTIAGVVLALIGYILTGTNPWVKAIQGDSLIVVDVNSTGVGKFYSATVKNNPFGGIDLNVDFGGGQTETRAYDRKVTHRIQSPLKLVMRPWNKKKDLVEGEVQAYEKAISFSMPKDTYEKAAWHYEYLTILYYNSETGMFLTKLDMREQEKQMQAEYLSLNEWRELKELNKTMRNFTRSTFDLIGQKMGGVFGSPMAKIFIIVIIVIIVIVGLILAFPQLMPVVQKAAESTGQVVQPLTPPAK